MVNAVGRQCYHCKSFKTIFLRKRDGKEYHKCGSCGKTFIYYPRVQAAVSEVVKRQRAAAQLTRERENNV